MPIIVKESVEVFKIAIPVETIVAGGDEVFTIVEDGEVFQIDIEDNSTSFILNDLYENINAQPIEETINAAPIEEVFDFTTSEPIIYHTTQQIISTTEEDIQIPYNNQVDFVGNDIIYKAWASPGISTSMPLWRIQKITFIGADEDIIITWADGDGNFDNIWDDRATLPYS